MVVRSRVLFVFGADEGQVFDARDVVGVRAVKVAAREARFIEPQKFSARGQGGRQLRRLLLTARAPVNSRRRRELTNLLDPGLERRRHTLGEGSRTGGLWGHFRSRGASVEEGGQGLYEVVACCNAAEQLCRRPARDVTAALPTREQSMSD